jgi:hypothetical protein
LLKNKKNKNKYREKCNNLNLNKIMLKNNAQKYVTQREIKPKNFKTIVRKIINNNKYRIQIIQISEIAFTTKR